MNAIGPGTYSLTSDNAISADATVVARINTGAPYTNGLNAQLVACTKAKLNRSSVFVQVVGIGDSITAGSTDPGIVTDGYRLGVNTSILSTYNGTYGSSVPVEWAGPTFAANASVPTQYSNGVGGSTTLSMFSRHLTDLGARLRLPHVLVVQIGANDAVGGIDAATFSSRYQSLVTAYHQDCPNAKIVVLYTPEHPADTAANALVSQYNTQFPSVWTTLETNLGITLYKASAPPGLVSGDMSTLTPIHPNTSTGYPKIASEATTPILAAIAATGRI